MGLWTPRPPIEPPEYGPSPVANASVGWRQTAEDRAAIARQIGRYWTGFPVGPLPQILSETSVAEPGKSACALLPPTRLITLED